MRSIKLAIIAITILFVLVQGAWAGETVSPDKKSADNLPHTAIYTVPDLTKDLSKDLVKSLGEVAGIISAKPDAKAGTFAVTFSPAKTDTDVIKAALDVVAPQAALSKIGPADPKAAHGDCSKCPKKGGCAKMKK